MKQFTHSEKISLSTLLSEIQDKSLQNILRDVLFSEKDVNSAIKTHRPETRKPVIPKGVDREIFQGHKTI